MQSLRWATGTWEVGDGALVSDTSLFPESTVPFSPFIPGVPGLPSEPGTPGMPGMPGMAGCPVQPLWARETWSRLRSISGSSTGTLPRGVFIMALLSRFLCVWRRGTRRCGRLQPWFVHSFLHLFLCSLSALSPGPCSGHWRFADEQDRCGPCPHGADSLGDDKQVNIQVNRTSYRLW